MTNTNFSGTTALDDVEQDSLASALRTAYRSITDRREWMFEDEYERHLARWRDMGTDLLNNGTMLACARDLFRPGAYALCLAALSMQPGGVRIGGVVFCATHYRDGIEAARRYACPRCDPDATATTDRRNVITIDPKGHTV